jgi:hypothetical protein
MVVTGVMDRKLSTILDHFASLEDAELARIADALVPYAAIVSRVADNMNPPDRRR